MTNLEPLWRRMAVRLANISLVHPNVLDRERKMAIALNDELAGVPAGRSDISEAQHDLLAELERLLKGEK